VFAVSFAAPLKNESAERQWRPLERRLKLTPLTVTVEERISRKAMETL